MRITLLGHGKEKEIERCGAVERDKQEEKKSMKNNQDKKAEGSAAGGKTTGNTVNEVVSSLKEYFAEKNLVMLQSDETLFRGRFGAQTATVMIGVEVVSPDFIEMYGYNFLTVPDGRREDPGLLKLMNELNRRFRIVRIFMDDDGELTLKADAYVNKDNVGEITGNLITAMRVFTYQNYPGLVREVWREEKK